MKALTLEEKRERKLKRERRKLDRQGKTKNGYLFYINDKGEWEKIS